MTSTNIVVAFFKNKQSANERRFLRLPPTSPPLGLYECTVFSLVFYGNNFFLF